MTAAKIARRGLLGAALLAAAPALALAAPAKPRVVIQTSLGRIVVELEDQKAPVTTANFLRYVAARKYDGGTFYRATRKKGVAGAGSIQGGTALRARRYAPIAHESTRQTGLRHKAGTISMARNEPGSATSDFFICASDMPYLDAKAGGSGDTEGYAAFGRVVEGLAVVRKILAQPADGPAPYPAMKGQILTTPVAITAMTRAG